MTSYTLVALFLLTGDAYVERRGLTLQSCAGHAALIRQETLIETPGLTELIGEVRYLCLPETNYIKMEKRK